MSSKPLTNPLRYLLLLASLTVSSFVFAVDTDGDGVPNDPGYTYQDSFESGNFTALPWVLSGDAIWTISAESVNSGVYVARSPSVPGGGNGYFPKVARMAITVTLPVSGNVLFKWSGSPNCDANCGYKFKIDNVTQSPSLIYTSSGTWEERSYPLSAGTHTLLWEIWNGSSSVPAGRMGVDAVRIGALSGGDADDDNDGVLDVNDAFPLNSAEAFDTDNDGVGNNADFDDDNDSVPDYIDAEPLNAAKAHEIVLPINNNYKGSTLRDSQLVP